MSDSLKQLKNTLLNIKPQEPKGFKGFLRQYFRALRFYLVTGFLVWTPFIVTIWLTWWIFSNVGLGVENVIKSGYEALNRLGERVDQLSFLRQFHYQPGFGFLITLALFLTTGFIARNYVGKRFIKTGEQLVSRIPFVRTIYKGVQQIRDVLFDRERPAFQKVVLIEFPRKGLWSLAFLVNEDAQGIAKRTGKPTCAVFYPTTPNPTTGFLVFLDPADLISTDLSIEDAFKMIMSAGAFDPARHASIPAAAQEEETQTTLV